MLKRAEKGGGARFERDGAVTPSKTATNAFLSAMRFNPCGGKHSMPLQSLPQRRRRPFLLELLLVKWVLGLQQFFSNVLSLS
jgi:hypothetical protein